MGGWVAWTCVMMLAVLLFAGRAGVCVDGCRSGSCIDAGWVGGLGGWEVGEDAEHGEDGCGDGRLGGWECES